MVVGCQLLVFLSCYQQGSSSSIDCFSLDTSSKSGFLLGFLYQHHRSSSPIYRLGFTAFSEHHFIVFTKKGKDFYE